MFYLIVYFSIYPGHSGVSCELLIYIFFFLQVSLILGLRTRKEKKISQLLNELTFIGSIF